MLPTFVFSGTSDPTTSSNIPFSLALRIVRICSEPETRDIRLAELRELLLQRDYKPSIIDGNIDKAKRISRTEAFKKVVKTKSTLFVVPYHPSLPPIPKIVTKHFRSMTINHHMKSIFPHPPLIAYKRPPNKCNAPCSFTSTP